MTAMPFVDARINSLLYLLTQGKQPRVEGQHHPYCLLACTNEMLQV